MSRINYDEPFILAEDEGLCTFKYEEEMIDYQADTNKQVKEDLASVDNDYAAYLKNLEEWGKSSGAAVGFEFFNTLEEFARKESEELVKSITPYTKDTDFEFRYTDDEDRPSFKITFNYEAGLDLNEDFDKIHGFKKVRSTFDEDLRKLSILYYVDDEDINNNFK